MSRKINRIVWHCSATSQMATPEAIATFWKTPKGPRGARYIPGVQGGRGWRHPGYAAIITPDGDYHMYCGMNQVTNGARGWNADSLHLCYIGGRDGDDRTDAQKRTMAQLTIQLTKPSRLGAIPVVGHRDLSPDRNGDGIITPGEWTKRCPSFSVKQWLHEIGHGHLWPAYLSER